MIKWLRQQWQPSSTENARSQHVWQPWEQSDGGLEQPDKWLAQTNRTQLSTKSDKQMTATSFFFVFF